MNLIESIAEECEAHWSGAGVQRATVLRLRRGLEKDLARYDDQRLIELLGDSEQLALTWRQGHREWAWRVVDALAYGAAVVAVYLWVGHLRSGSEALQVPSTIWILFGLGGGLGWVLSDLRWAHLRQRGLLVIWLLWPGLLAGLAAAVYPAAGAGRWPLVGTALLTLAAAIEAVASWCRGAGASGRTPAGGDVDVEVVVQSVLDRGFFRGWPRSQTLPLVSELRSHLLDARADGKQLDEVIGPHPEEWVEEWAEGSGIRPVRLSRTRLVVAVTLWGMAVVTFPYLLDGRAQVRMDFTLWIGIVLGVFGWLVTRHMARIWLSADERRRDRMRTVAIFIAGSVLFALLAVAGGRLFGEVFGPVGWAVPITLLAALALLDVARLDPFRR